MELKGLPDVSLKQKLKMLLSRTRRDDGDFHGFIDRGFERGELSVDGDAHARFRQRMLPVVAAGTQPGQQRAHV